MIICTENDENFNIYKDKINNRKVVFTIKQIFEDNWNKFLSDNPNIKIRDIVYSNVNRMLKCKTTDLGFSLFVCEHCGKEKIILHTCKSRMCSSCGNKYNKQREASIFSKLIRCNHRHVVFTIPEELRILFLKDRKRLDYLFKAASITVNYWVKNKYKKKDLIPAYVSILHTFGRSLVFNPHIHMILLDGGISNKCNEFVKINFFSYPSFRKRFMKVLLDLLENDIGKDNFKRIKNQVYLDHQEGFYVYAPPSKYKKYTDLIKYVCRYVARPVMAESRILNYDGDFVTFWYQRHNDDLIIVEKVTVYEFIKRIIVHIPESNYKQIRFYGAYHNSTKIKIDINTYISKEKFKIKRVFNTWRFLLIQSFKKDPLNCPNCSSTMIYYDSVFP